jgi:hypothetical protein
VSYLCYDVGIPLMNPALEIHICDHGTSSPA